jgi:mono/diheme cytochrome c family protein
MKQRALVLALLVSASVVFAVVSGAQTQSAGTPASTGTPGATATATAGVTPAATATPTASSGTKPAASIRLEPSMRIEGEKRFHANCGRCHMAPTKFAPRAAATVIRHMRVRATITDEDMRYILAYLAQ